MAHPRRLGALRQSFSPVFRHSHAEKLHTALLASLFGFRFGTGPVSGPWIASRSATRLVKDTSFARTFRTWDDLKNPAWNGDSPSQFHSSGANDELRRAALESNKLAFSLGEGLARAAVCARVCHCAGGGFAGRTWRLLAASFPGTAHLPATRLLYLP